MSNNNYTNGVIPMCFIKQWTELRLETKLSPANICNLEYFFQRGELIVMKKYFDKNQKQIGSACFAYKQTDHGLFQQIVLFIGAP